MMTDRGIAHRLGEMSNADCVNAAHRRETAQIPVSDDTIIVMYLTTRQNGTSVKNDLRRRVDDVHRRVILVFRELPVNVDAVGARLREEYPTVKFETFSLAELQYNVTEHVLVPKHERVTDADTIRSILKTYGIKRNQLPLIQRTDAVCKYLGIEPGDLVRIHRTSPSSGVHVAYRMCV